MKILVVDDDPQVLRMMARLLGSRGHDVETQEGPFGTAVTAMRSHPDVILLDCMMPALDGVRLSAVLAEVLAPLPRVLLWSADDETLSRVAAESGLQTLSKKQPLEHIIEALEQNGA